MRGVIVVSVLAILGAGDLLHAQSEPRVVPFFSRVTEAPAFFVECVNLTKGAVSSGDERWAFAAGLRIDGKEIVETGGRIGPGLKQPVEPGETWRGIIELRQSNDGYSATVAFRAMVRGGRIQPLSPGRHTFAVRCFGVWSQDIAFYWEDESFRR
jgi:hypothetical protein